MNESTSDVIVMGGGGSGLAAAVAAAEAGNTVRLFEKHTQVGGTTARSIGSISATRTRHQQRLGIEDDPLHHFEDMAKFPNQFAARPDNDELRRVLAENVSETVRWLESMGVEFFGPLEEAPHRKPRMHNVLPGSRAYIFHLHRRARQLGVDIRTGAAVSGLRGEGGRVTGVEIGGQPPASFHARKGVIIASGDYSASPDMKAELISREISTIDPINPVNTGDGIRLAIALGATLSNGDMYGGGLRFVPPRTPSPISRIPPWKWLMRLTNMTMNVIPRPILTRFLMGFLTTVLVPSHKLFAAGAILVNNRGERFVEEQGKDMFFELSGQPAQECYIVLDHALATKFSSPPYYVSTAPGFAYAFIPDYRSNRPDLFHSGHSIEALASRIGADPALLAKSIETCNGSRRKTPSSGPVMDTPPYYALGPAKNYINYTDGGLTIDHRFRVLRADGSPIEGLYAAGSAGQSGLLLRGHGHHLGWAFTSGRLVGRSMADVPASGVP